MGFLNGLIVSGFVFFKLKSNPFLKMAALAVFLFSLTILREFLHVFGEEIEMTIIIEHFLFLKLLVVGIVLLGYEKSVGSLNTKSYNYLIPGIIEVMFLSAIAQHIIQLPQDIADAIFVGVDCLAFFWIAYAIYTAQK